jgi:hypothetical protein
MRNLDKHAHYRDSYQPNDTYWGIGIEHETYLETNKLKQVTPKDLKEHKEPERYSVRYYDVYTTELWEKTIDDMSPQGTLLLPILVNSHTFQHADLAGEHPHTADRIPRPNPKYQGTPLLEWMKEQNPDVFRDEYDKSYTLDGDSIEFKTQHFYKATVKQVLQELAATEKEFMRALNSLPREGILKLYAPLHIPQQNYPFASYITNLKHNAMFHNGTIHINLTLPTKLDAYGQIENKSLFVERHRKLARAIQWLSPLLVAVYGTPDPLSESRQYGAHYAAGSQRVAVSRFTGLGTYDTDQMEEGIILTKKREHLSHINWYESFHRAANYVFFDHLGMDLNFHKYDGHGLELRFLEAMPPAHLEEILTFLPYLAEFAWNTSPPNPKKSPIWHILAEQSVHLGKGYRMDVSVQYELFGVFGVEYLSKEPLLVEEVWRILKGSVMRRYREGPCVSCFLHGQLPEGQKEQEQKEQKEQKEQNKEKLEEIELSPLSSHLHPYDYATTSVYGMPPVPPIQEEEEGAQEQEQEQDQEQEQEQDQDQVPAKKQSKGFFSCC